MINVAISQPQMGVGFSNPVIREGGGEPYTGEYEVTPSAETQTLATANKKLTDDVTVNPIPSGWYNTLKECVIRPDAVLEDSWTYDKRIVADEGVTIPAYTTTAQTLKATEQLDEITADVDNYRYFLTFRTLVIPEYSNSNPGRGRFEWSSMVGAYEFVFTPREELKPIIPGEYRVSTNSAAVQGNVSYRSLYFASATSLSIYATNTYGIWTPNGAPTYTSGKMKINSPNFTIRGQQNILDQQFWEAITDIRFQYVYELWKVPLGSLQYDGWQNQQSVDLSLDCLYSQNRKLR